MQKISIKFPINFRYLYCFTNDESKSSCNKLDMKTKAIVLTSSVKLHSSFHTHHIFILTIISCVPLNSILYDCSYDKKTIKILASYHTQTACVILLIYTWNLHSFSQSFLLKSLLGLPTSIFNMYKPYSHQK